MADRGKFIVFEGLDGCGKTTQLFNLKRKLNEYGVRCLYEREPSDGIIGIITRGAVKKKLEFRQESLAHLFAADRFEHVVNDVLPQLDNGVAVLCDRFVFSNLAFQSMVLPMETVWDYNRITTDLLMPDLTIFIDVPAEVCAKRIRNERVHLELFEDSDKTSLVRDNFLKSFELVNNANIAVINGEKSEGIVFDHVWDAVKPLFGL